MATMTVYEKLFVNQDLVASYAKGRPTYTPILFQLLASLTHQHERAWDVGTGSGQAAIGVSEVYKSVVATDVSEPQLSHGMQRPNITYTKMSAGGASVEELERIVGPEGSVDLVTVACALSYFDLDQFYPVVKHVLRKPGGVFAAWNYSTRTMHVCPEFDDLLYRWMDRVLSYKKLDRIGLTELPFPFDPVPGVEARKGVEAGKGVEGSPLEMKMEKQWAFDDVVHMMRSFSPVQVALEQGVDLLNEGTKEAFSKAWGPERVRTVTMTLYVLIGTVPAASPK